jgi:hypothetical protein
VEWAGLESCPVSGFGIDYIELCCSAVRGFIGNKALTVPGCEDWR